MKKFRTLAAAVAALLVLSACKPADPKPSEGTGKETEPSESQTMASEKETEGTTKESESSTEPSGQVSDFVIPELPKGDGSEVIIWNQVFEEWNQNHFQAQSEKYNTLDRGYTVKQEFVPGDAWNDKMLAAQSTGTAPDAYIISYNNVYGAVVDQSILPLDDIFTKEQLDDILPNVRDMVTFDGKVWAYPQLVEPSTVLFYRTDLFEEAGLDGPPKTWDELIEYGKKLSTGDVFGLGISGFGEMGWTSWGWQMQAAGHLALNDNWDTATIDDGYVELANLWKTLYDEGIVPEQPLTGYAELSAFGEGALAMDFSGSWGIAQLMNDYPETFEKTAVAVPPTKDGNTESPIATNGGWTYVIDAKSQNVQGAYNYLSWLLAEDPATPAEFFEIAQYSKAPTRTSVAAYISSQGGTPQHAEVINEIAARSIPEPNYPWDISVAVANMFEKVAIGGVDVEQARAEATDLINTIITDQKLAGTNPRQ